MDLSQWMAGASVTLSAAVTLMVSWWSAKS